MSWIFSAGSGGSNYGTICSDFVAWRPHVKLHLTPTYSSWLNQVESWFSKLQREIIDRGIFTS